MKRMLKKSLALLLALTMVFGTAPLAGFVGIELPEFNLFGTKAEAATYSGKCGDNLTWSLDTNICVLEISGTGNMKNWNSSSSVPWYNYRSSIKTVVIGNGVTSICDYAFYNCFGLTSITIPGGVTIIGNSAFSDCFGLTNVTIPDSVKSIGWYAFSDCTGLTSVTIGNGVMNIGNKAFYGCTRLTSVTIPDSVTSIGDYVFCNCTGLTSITIPDSVTSIGDYVFYKCAGLKSVIIPDSVTSIGNYAFSSCTELTSVTFERNSQLTSIGNYAFSDCTGLTSVTIPDSVTNIGDEAFYYCKGLTSVTIGNGVTSIGDDAFYCCTGLTSVYYTGDIAGWCSIDFNGSYANPMYYANNLYINGKKVEGELVIPNGVESIGAYAFYNCTGLTNITIGNSVTSMGGYAFYNCTGLTSIEIPDSVSSIGNYAFYNTGLYNDSSNWENGVLYIGNYLINAKFSISGSYSIKSGTKVLADRVFYHHTGLTSITIPDSVTSIGEDAFYNCTGLTNVTFGENSQLTSIGSFAFTECTGLTSVTIPASVTSIGDGVLKNCDGLTNITVDGNNPNYSSDESGALFNKDKTELIQYPIGSEETEYIISNSVASIGNYAFYNCNGLTSITISDSVTSIGYEAFYNCTGLTNITIPDSVTSIGNYAFSFCTELTSITIGNSVTNIDFAAFFCCTGLTSVYYTGDVAGWCSICFSESSSNPMCYADSLYINNKKIEGNLVIPDSITSIGDCAFYNCDGITSVTIPDSITSIGDEAFGSCSNISATYYEGTWEQWNDISTRTNDGTISENIVFECDSDRPYYHGDCGEKLTWNLYLDGELVVDGIGEMFNYRSVLNTPWYSRCSIIKSVTIDNGVTSVGESAFYNCTGLECVTLSKNVTKIGASAFAKCNNLKKIEFLGHKTSIADYSFENSPNVVIYCKLGSSAHSFAERNSLMYVLTDSEYSDVIIKDNQLGSYQLVSYQGDSSSPKIPSYITSIGPDAFKDNSTAKTVELPNKVSSIYSGAFSNCSSLERIVIPHTVTTIAPDAFNGTNATIVCYANSYAHQYAIEKGINFELISVTLNQTKVILSVGEYSIITATPEQEYLDSVQISWKSSETGVARVDANGKVTAQSNGTATIYALAPTGETLATCSVQVGYSFVLTIQNPSTKTISYKSGIVLHATVDNLPAGAKIVWEKDNDNFSMSDAGNGNCIIVSKANGSTKFTAKVKLANGLIARDSNDNEISAQVTMNSKAGFFDKIVAFFKGLFGGNKVLPQLFKGIF